MEIISDGVIDKALRSLRLSTSLVLEYHIIIPPKQIQFNSHINYFNIIKKTWENTEIER